MTLLGELVFADLLSSALSQDLLPAWQADPQTNIFKPRSYGANEFYV
jgi:hypothetical protein